MHQAYIIGSLRNSSTLYKISWQRQGWLPASVKSCVQQSNSPIRLRVGGSQNIENGY